MLRGPFFRGHSVFAPKVKTEKYKMCNFLYVDIQKGHGQ